MLMLYAILAALTVSAASFVGLIFLFSDKQMHSRRLHMLLALATGAMIGNAVLHLLPHAFSLEPTWHNPAPIVEVINEPATVDHDHDGHDHQDHPQAVPSAGHSHAAHGESGLYASFLLILGMLGFYGFDLAIQRCNRETNPDCKSGEEAETGKIGGVSSEGWLVLIGDGVENFLDGFVIGASFLLGVPVGIAATITIFIHEIPLELGDYAVLRHAGFSRGKALLANFASGSVSVLGVLVSIYLGSIVPWFTFAATPVAAGAFIYIASSILVPKLRRECADGNGLLYFGMSVLGVGAMALILLLE
ncbi:MAG: ZIP family metal transporter [Candidatus Obscuribacterales bacterium]